MTRTIQTIALAMVAMTALALNGCNKPLQPATTGLRAELATATRKDGSAVHLCGAPLKNGGTCKRHVKHEGEVCWMHRAK